jgi:hypothetical protein
MKEYPPTPCAADAPDRLFDEGHLWVLEQIDGATLRFQLQEAGFLRFGDDSRVYDAPDAVPTPYRSAVRHVRERLDRDALRAAADDVEEVVFFGVSTHRHGVAYDWDRIPPFLGVDIWDGETFLTPGAVQRVFEELGLRPVNAVERELPARDFHPDRYTIPDSAWYDGPAAGVVVRNKRGDRATLRHPLFEESDEAVPVDASAEELAARYATRQRFEALATELDTHDEPVTVDRLQQRAIEDIAREHHRELYRATDPVDMSTFRSEVGALTREFLTDRYG